MTGLKPNWQRAPLQLLNRKVSVGVNTKFAGDAHSFQAEILCAQLGMLEHSACCSHRKTPAGADRAKAIVRLDYISIAGQKKSTLAIGNDQQRLEVTKRTVLAPFLGQFHRGFRKVSGVFLELALKTLKQS